MQLHSFKLNNAIGSPMTGILSYSLFSLKKKEEDFSTQITQNEIYWLSGI